MQPQAPTPYSQLPPLTPQQRLTVTGSTFGPGPDFPAIRTLPHFLRRPVLAVDKLDKDCPQVLSTFQWTRQGLALWTPQTERQREGVGLPW